MKDNWLRNYVQPRKEVTPPSWRLSGWHLAIQFLLVKDAFSSRMRWQDANATAGWKPALPFKTNFGEGIVT